MKWINGWLMWILSLVLWAFLLEVQGQSFTNVAAARNVDLGGNKDGGLCWADFNNDGFLDLAVNTNDNGFFSKSRLFIWNSGTSLFDDVTATDVNTQFNDRRERSALAGDFDNDGDVDFMRSTSTQLEIYRNTGAPNYNLVLFQEFTSGVAPFNGTTQNGMNNEGLAWMDFDGDGDLDVYMEDHQYGQDILEYDQGTGLFVHYTPDSDPKGFPITGTSGDYSVTADLDNDGYVDVVARRQGTNTQAPTDIRGYDIFFNDGDGTFSPNTTVNLQTNNSYKGGVAVADFDNDGDFDYMWTNHDDGTGTRSVLVVEQTGFNTRIFQIATVTVTPGGTGTLNALPDEQIEGIAMADVNNDGKVDVFLAADSGPSYLLINNNTGGNFSFIHENYGINVNADGEGLAFGDYDDDGDMDFYLNIRNGNNQLWENDLSGNTDYLKIEPLIDLGGGITRAAIGATVVVDEQGCSALKFIQEVSGGVGHGAQNDSRLHFGLPNGPNIRYKITVSFVRPNGGARTVVQKYVTPSALAGQTIQVLDTDTSDPDADPNAVNDSYTVSMNSSNNALDVMDNDSDPNGENLTLSLPSAVTANGGTVTVNNNSTPLDPTDDFIDYTPANGFFGVDNFDYEITNVSLFCSSASATITVNGQPTSSDNTVSTPEDITYSFTTGDFTVGYSDPEGDAFAEIRITSLESVGNLLYNGNPVTLNQVISAADITSGLLTFVPVAGQSGSPYDSFDFEVGDGTDFSVSDYTLTINVTPVNDPPVGSDNTVSTPEDITYTFTTGDFTVGYSDPEGDAFAEIRITSLESVGNLLYNGNPVTLNQVISAGDITSGLLTFVPVGNQSGSPYDSFDFEVGDGTDFSVSDYTLTINVTPVNDPPVSSDNTVSTPEDITYTFTSADFTVGYSDPEGDAFAEIRITSLESVGNLLYNGNPVTLNQVISAGDITSGLLTFVPVGNQSGSPYDSFDFEVGDGTDFSVSDYTLTINVTPVNDPPVSSDNTVSTPEDITYTFTSADFTVGYSDPEGDAFAEIRITSLESVGNLLYNGNPVTLNQVISAGDITSGLLTFVPVGNQSGSPYDSFDFEVGDGTDFSVSDYTLTINVTPVNDPPVGSDNTVSTPEDITYTFTTGDFTVGYSDPEGDAFAEIRITSLESVGNLLYNGNPVTLNQVISAADITSGLLTFVPVAGQSGSPYDSFDFEVGDGTDFSVSDYTLTINVTPVNDPPVGSDNTVSTPEDITYTFTTGDFTVGYSDPEGDAFAEIRITSLESVGNLLYNGNPVTLNQMISAADITSGLLTFVPVGNQSGSPYDSFDFEVGDGTNFSVSDYTLTINVTPVNDAPVSSDNTVTTTENVTYTFTTGDFTVGYSDPEGDAFAEIRITSLESVGNLLYNGNPVTLNQVISAADITSGLLTFVPVAGQFGSPYDSFDFEVGDGSDFSTLDYTLTVNVTPINDPPVSSDNTVSTPEDITYTFTTGDFTVGYSDPEGDAFAEIRITSLESVGNLLYNGNPVTLNQVITAGDITSGLLTFVPVGNQSGSPYDSFDFEVGDGTDFSVSDYTLTINVTPVNDAPVSSDNTIATPEDITYTFTAADFTVGYSDPEGDAFAEIRITSLESVGNLLYNGNPVTLNQVISAGDITSGLLTFVPVGNQSGSPYDSFDFEVGDGTDFSVSDYTLTINVTPVNDAPVSSDNTIATPEDITYTFTAADFTVGYSDPEGDAFAEIRITSLESVGNLLYNGNPVTLNQVISVADITSGLLTFVPVAGQIGSPYDSFDFEVGDGTDFSVSDYTLTINVTPVNDPPVGSDNTVSTPEDITYTFTTGDFTVSYSDPEGDAFAEIRITSLESVGNLLYNGNPVTLNQVISAADITSGLLTFVPVGNQSGSPYDSFDFEVGDGMDFSIGDYTLTVNVTPLNDVPNAVNDVTSTVQDISLTIDVFSNDDLGDTPTNISSVDGTTTQGGTASINNNGTPADPSDDFIDYAPPNGFLGTDTFTYTIQDSDGETSTATVTIDVTIPNNSPLAVDDNGSTSENTGIPVNVLANDNLGDTPTTISSVDGTTTQGGTAVINNNGTPADPSDDFIDYTPANGFTGSDTFTYTIQDNDGETSTATVTIDVTIPNNSPLAVDDNGSTSENTGIPVNVLANDNLGDTPTAISSVDGTTTQGGTAVINNNGTPADPSDDFIDYTPANGFTGSDTFTYTIQDNDGETSTATVTIIVNAIGNNNPIANDDTYNTNIDTPLGIATPGLLGNDSDPDSDPLIVSGFDAVSTNGGTVSVNADGSFLYTPPAGFFGVDNFTYTVSDGRGGFQTATVTINVSNTPNTPPVIVDINMPGLQDQNVDFSDLDFLNAYSDADGDPLNHVEIISLPNNGNLFLNGNPVTVGQILSVADLSNLQFVPDPGFIGTTNFQWIANDGKEDSAPAQVIIDLAPDDNLIIYKGFSPNGDGSNDQWVIDGILSYPSNVVKVFNRWGNLVYEEAGYDNQSKVWFGQSNQGLVLGKKDLPDGTYFYMVELGDGSEQRSGYVMLKR